ncbi:NLI interacting factor-like phosphatase-domain-containing protein [Bisporella sp. PMI_857]|nr:NLI interacting factor-like phosphatase-domain-containing protein [Bisporella sp. PMI_857]
MNSLNILSARVSPPQTPSPSRSNSYGNILSSVGGKDSRRGSRGDDLINENTDGAGDIADAEPYSDEVASETTPLIKKESDNFYTPPSPNIISRLSSSFIDSIRWVLSTLAAPGVYFIACFYDEGGKFAPFSQLRKLGNIFSGSARRASATQALENASSDGENNTTEKRNGKGAARRASGKESRFLSSNSSSSGLSSESESERDRSMSEGEVSSNSVRHTRSKSLQSGDEISPARRSIRIKLHDESVRQKKHNKSQSTSTRNSGVGVLSSTKEITPATLKSPTSPATSLSMTKYPRAPAPPRPLIPKRQPSYTLPDVPASMQKTLILDLDETLIHSMSKGGRMSTGHMVEVKLNTISVAGGNAIGPQHPILYYVHKRPHCDDFLRRVCKWYNLVIFTASVQEYADPVIDWLEQERKFFSGRYYRQHCTFRHGAFIKDLTSIEPDLSKVMILDNSPLSYMFHQDNAIPIEGWINDPTDNDLLHLVPLLEGLQYVTDVRAFLALRGGEDGKHAL